MLYVVGKKLEPLVPKAECILNLALKLQCEDLPLVSQAVIESLTR